MSNEKVYVLDEQLQLVPVGVNGELYIAGAGLSRGYLNQPDLTDEKFILNPYATADDIAKGYTRMYRTGDSVRWQLDGTLKYISRNDEQVKVNGYRIELKEIEQALLKVKEINAACVVAKELQNNKTQSKSLVAYYVSDRILSYDQIMSVLADQLPNYMVPLHYIALESIPLTVNGKVDKKALPDPDFTVSNSDFVAPSTPDEINLCEIWKEILGLGKVGVNDNFFSIGGNSMLAIQVSHLMSKALNKDVKIADIFKYKTIAHLIKFLNKEERLPSITKLSGSNSELSFSQERLWFIEQFEKGTSTYNVPLLYKLDHTINLSGINYALEKIVNRHKLFRSTIEYQTGQDSAQVVIHDRPLLVERIILSRTNDYFSSIKEALKRPFDLTAEYPIRAYIYTIAATESTPEEQLLLINAHHIVLDGWSVQIFENEMQYYYEAFVNGSLELDLPDLEIDYMDFAAWQRNWLKGEVLDKQLSYWKNRLDNFEPLSFPTDFERPSKINYQGANYDFELPPTLSKAVTQLAAELQVSVHSLLLGGFTVLLNKYTGQEDIVTGSLIANRHHPQTKDLIGFFVNTIVNRTLLHNVQTFVELVHQIHADQTEAQYFQDLPFEKLIAELKSERDPSRHPLFQLLFTVESSNTSPASKYWQEYTDHEAYETARFDLTFALIDSPEGLKGQVNYATSLFKPDTIQRMVGHYIQLMQQLVAEPKAGYRKFSMLTPVEYNQIINQWSSGEQQTATQNNIVDAFREQVRLTPTSTAVDCEGTELSYLELEKQSNQIADCLMGQYNVQPGDFVGIVLDRSEKMSVSIMGVLKAGAAYVCIDPDYPVSRKEFIIQDTGLKTLITQTDYLFDLEFYSGNLVAIDIQLDTLHAPAEIALPVIYPETTAYIIYTSGTTGNPKGVVISHKAVLSLVNNSYINVNSDDVFAFLSSPSFDASTFEVFTPLLKGCKLIIPKQIKNLVSDGQLFKQFIERNKITVLWLTKTLFEHIYHLDNTIFKGLNYLIAGGEALNKATLNKLVKQANKPKHFLNGYGPTESTTFTCTYSLNNTIASANVPIGKPINNRYVYILDRNSNPVPVGVPGELYIGGDGLSGGYLNRPDLTAEKFVEISITANTTARVYKTGDVVRWLDDGNIEYIGRNDNQIKIRGHRIELGEIENTLLSIDGIKQVVVLCLTRKTESENSKYLAAYYVCKDDSNLSSTVISGRVNKLLPDFMVPHVYVKMESLPFTINGKLDTDALPAPDFTSSQDEYVAPDSLPEKELCALWQEVLGIDRVGVTDNFFRIGGDSILSIRLVAKMKQSGYSVTEKDIFDHKTIRELLANISKGEIRTESVYVSFSLVNENTKKELYNRLQLDPEQIEDIYPAAYLQTGMLIESMKEESYGTYHDVLSFSIDTPFVYEKFTQVWEQLVAGHGQLRAALVAGNEGCFNLVYRKIDLQSKIFQARENCSLEQLVDEEKNTDFNFSEPGIFRLLLHITNPGTFTLIFSIHHAITDGWSVATVMNEFTNLYVHQLSLDGTPAPSYAKVIAAEIEALGNPVHKSFWMNYLGDYELKSTNLVMHEVPVGNSDFIYDETELSLALSTRLIELARELNTSPDLIFLGVYNLVLSMFCNTDDMVVGIVVNNRLVEEGGDKTFGLHLNTVPFRIKTDRNKTIKDYFSELFKEKLSINAHKQYPYARIKADLKLQEDIYQCSFNYVNFHVAEENIKNQSLRSEYSVAKTNIPLTMHVSRFQDKFTLIMSSGTGFVDPITVKNMLGTAVLYLNQIAAHPEKFIKDYATISAEEHDKLIHAWNSAQHSFNIKQTLPFLFEKVAGSNPEKVALVYEGQQLTYRQLNEKTSQLANVIRKRYQEKTSQAIMPGTYIALCLNRSLEMVIAMIATLKAGAAYVPIDPDYPKDRIDFILEDTQAQVLITQRALSDITGNLRGVCSVYADLDENEYTTESTECEITHLDSSALAYVIYTSGTTGQPKGVMISHEAAVYYLHTFRALIDRTQMNMYAVLNYCFDASLPTLLSGMIAPVTTHIAPATVFMDRRIETYIQEHGINVMRLTPSLLNSLSLETIKQELSIVMGGEKISYASVNSLIKNKNIRLFNQYGPTESTVGTTAYSLHQEIGRQLIGKPYPGKKVFVLDGFRQPVPVGVTGELYIGGDGLSNGYLNREELNHERFVANSFVSDTDKGSNPVRLYRTGDMVRWLADGNLEYIGRNDEQVKIRGYRVELGEIEHTILSIKGIKQVAVIIKQRHTTHETVDQLIAYYVNNPDVKDVTVASIKEILAERLPAYMLPVAYIQLDSLPLTTNGKLDKRALPDPDFGIQQTDYVAPVTELELAMCEIWKELLGVSKMGTTDDFFRIGGNSILAIQLSHRMSLAAAADIKVADIFRLKTIAAILERVNVSQIEEAENVQMIF